MAQTFKSIDKTKDIKSFKTKLHESIPVTGSIVAYTSSVGTTTTTYGIYVGDTNIKKYTHGLFQSVYDYPHLSSSANQIFDLTFGVSPQWTHDEPLGSTVNDITSQATDKQNIYKQMAQVLVGHDISGAIMQFDHLGQPATSSQTQKLQSALFMNFSRMLAKDEIAKGTFEMYVGTGSWNDQASFTVFDEFPVRLSDSGSSVYTNSPAGEYGIIYSASAGQSYDPTDADAVGLIYYQAGVVALELSGAHANHANGGGLFGAASNGVDLVSASAGDYDSNGGHNNVASASLSASIDAICDGFRRRIGSISFKNTIELNSTVYFCRANASEYNYSSNPTYIDANGKIRVKQYVDDSPASYITTVGLYHSDGALMAVGKLSEPIKKTDASDFTIRVRLDY